MKTTTVTGIGYGEVVQGDYTHGPGDAGVWLSSLDGRPAIIEVSDQYGWEDGCVPRNTRRLTNPRYIKGNSGSARSVGDIHIEECDWVLEDRRHGYWETLPAQKAGSPREAVRVMSGLSEEADTALGAYIYVGTTADTPEIEIKEHNCKIAMRHGTRCQCGYHLDEVPA